MASKTHNKKRSMPRNKKHRAALEFTSTPTKTERIVLGAKKRYEAVLKAHHNFDTYIKNQVVDGIIGAYNEKVDPEERFDGMPLFDNTGDVKLTIERQINRSFDGRADMAHNMISEYIKEMEGRVEYADADTKMVYDFLRGIFFKKRGGFKWTPQLNDFLMWPEDRINDSRLKKAQKLLREAVHIDRSNWYAHIYLYKHDQSTGKGAYVKMTILDILKND